MSGRRITRHTHNTIKNMQKRTVYFEGYLPIKLIWPYRIYYGLCSLSIGSCFGYEAYSSVSLKPDSVVNTSLLTCFCGCVFAFGAMIGLVTHPVVPFFLYAAYSEK